MTEGGESERDFQAEADLFLDATIGNLEPETAALVLALLANRAATRLHVLARAQALARRDTAAWGDWAGLQNASRKMVLEASTVRDLSGRLAGRRR